MDDEKCAGSVTPSNDGVQRRDCLSSPKDATLCDLIGTFKAHFKTYHLGTYELETDAAMTYDNATMDFKVKGSPYNSIGHGVHSRKNES
eukprot:scaffold13345_cov209-Alexandrium_tamarense.AAC.13